MYVYRRISYSNTPLHVGRMYVHMFDFFFEYFLNDLPPSRNRSIQIYLCINETYKRSLQILYNM